MFSQDEDKQQGFILSFVFGVVALVVAAVIGVGVHQRSKAAKPAASTAVRAATAVVAPAASTAQAAMDAASVKIENGSVVFYFSSGKADLAAGAGAALEGVVAGAKAGRKLAISGFHDATGGAAQNAELARQRAFAVRDALRAAGVDDATIELKKPKQMTTAGSDAEARRVEVTLR